ncbi:HNH endonuclease [Halobacterium salinarum]|uniref:HNH endonuclease n=1 Tax=Halobacterium salinarum TaxID=2242 RepID=UPI002557A599|nr:HNH endonuclease [Halobacterium salinarum]MDL0135107.1 HNH endonuclease [Halobacterium salinarum]
MKDLQHVAMYLDEELADDLDTRFKELDLKYKKVHGEGIEKNRDFYPAVARATINNTTVEEELGLDE